MKYIIILLFAVSCRTEVAVGCSSVAANKCDVDAGYCEYPYKKAKR